MGLPRPGYFADYRETNRDRLRRRQRRDRYKNKQAGLCKHCTSPVMENSRLYCFKHWCVQIAAHRLGKGTVKLAAFLQDLLERQNYLCPYTSKKLVPGVNASLDHVLPVVRYPGLAGDITNVEWVDITVNCMKGSMTKDEFLGLCRSIAGRHPGDAVAVTVFHSPDFHRALASN